MHLSSAQFSFCLFRLPTHSNAHTHTQTGVSSAPLALAEQQEGGIRWLGQVDGTRRTGRGLTNESRQVTFTDVKGWRGRGGRRWVKGGEGVCQLILVHRRKSPALIRKHCSQERERQRSGPACS